MQALRSNAAPRIGNDTVRIWLYAGKPVYPTLLTILSGLTGIVVTTCWVRKTSRKD